MPNVVTSLARKLRTARSRQDAQARHRRDGWFDESDTWHDAENEPSALADGTTSH
jgi:hypothetical protein